MAPRHPPPAPESMVKRSKNAHPGRIDLPNPRRTSAQMKEIRDAEAQAHKASLDAQNLAAKKVAQVEDGLQRVEALREEMRRLRGQPSQASTTKDDMQFIESEDSSKDEEYVEEEEADSDSDKGDGNQPKGGRKRKKRTTRDDISVLRTVATPGPVATNIESFHAQTKKKFKATNLPSGISASYRPAQTKRSYVATPVASSDDSQAQMVQYGGFVGDADTDVSERQALESSRGGNTKMVKVVANPPATMTQKQARGGHGSKWTLDHLPDGTKDRFKAVLVPSIRKFLGTLEPWELPTIEQLQELVDKVYGFGEYTVDPEYVWERLISYRVHSWRNGFASAAADVLARFIDKYRGSSFKSKDDIAQWVENMLEELPLDPKDEKSKKSSAYHWREWNQGTHKRGFLRNYLILETFAAAHLSYIPEYGSFVTDERKPVGALLLSMQAVYHAFQSWKTGAYVVNNPTHQFSHRNYADKVTAEQTGTGPQAGRTLVVRTRRATLFLATVRKFKPSDWQEILEYSEDFVASKKPTRGSSPIPESVEIVDEDGEILVVSDNEEIDEHEEDEGDDIVD